MFGKKAILTALVMIIAGMNVVSYAEKNTHGFPYFFTSSFIPSYSFSPIWPAYHGGFRYRYPAKQRNLERNVGLQLGIQFRFDFSQRASPRLFCFAFLL